MLENELKEYLEDFKKEHGEEVRVSVLARHFMGFKPHYRPRQGVEATDEARRASVSRSVTKLYNALLEAVVNERLTASDPEGTVDFNDISQHHGGNDIGTKTMPDYAITLDDAFITFTQSLGSSIGGRKTDPNTPATNRSQEANEFVQALQRLQQSSNKDAKAFIETYKSLQKKLRLPRLS